MSTPDANINEPESVRILREYVEASIEAQRAATMEQQMCGLLMRNADAYLFDAHQTVVSIPLPRDNVHAMKP